jgi:hypothetical protein
MREDNGRGPGDRQPGRIARLPRNAVGYPVPWFVAWIDGVPDFRVIKPGAIGEALRAKLCWTCGIPFQRQEDRAFVIGPMCAVNRVSAEPPSHRDCAIFAATACPFLTTPQMARRERHIPDGAVIPAGISIPRNPGVALVWVAAYRAWKPFKDQDGGTLVDVGEPKEALWFARGREATRDEIMASIGTGLPILQEMAGSEGPDAVAELERMHQRALELVPA